MSILHNSYFVCTGYLYRRDIIQSNTILSRLGIHASAVVNSNQRKYDKIKKSKTIQGNCERRRPANIFMYVCSGVSTVPRKTHCWWIQHVFPIH